MSEYEAAANGADPDAAASYEETPSDAGGEETWAPPGQDWYQRVDQFTQQAGPALEQINYFLQAAQQQAYQQQQEEGYDPGSELDPNIDPEAYINDRVEQGIQQALGEYAPMLDWVTQRESETVAHQALDSIAQEIGVPFDRDHAVVFARQLQEAGLGADEALRHAAAQQAEFEKQIRIQAVEEYKASLNAQPPVQVPAGAGAARETEPVPRGSDKYEVLANRWLTGTDFQSIT